MVVSVLTLRPDGDLGCLVPVWMCYDPCHSLPFIARSLGTHNSRLPFIARSLGTHNSRLPFLARSLLIPRAYTIVLSRSLSCRFIGHMAFTSVPVHLFPAVPRLEHLCVR